MLLLPCPNCGPRNSDDLTYGGEIQTRPDPATADPQEWREYLYLRDNPCGGLRESWYCAGGCRRWFQLERHTLSGELRAPILPGTAGGPASTDEGSVSEGTE